MSTQEWTPQETNNHQDHIIAHVVGATVLGYFHADDALRLLLDIGFIWTIYLDGEMGLLPQSVTISELNVGDEERTLLVRETHKLLDVGREAGGLMSVTPAPVGCLIEEVSLYAGDDGCKVVIRGEETSLAVVSSTATREMRLEIIT